jgi:kynurenine formamidase
MTSDEERRVQFDFEIEFSNGGGIQGQGFRLDIDGADISDVELAEYIVRDLRLLMVSEVRILNKEVIAERHKRVAQSLELPSSDESPQFVDLSHTIENGMVTYRGLPAPVICDYFRHEDGRHQYAPGVGFQIGQISMSANTGTYVDSPYHRHPHGADLSELSLQQLANVQGIVVDVTGGSQRAVGVEQFLPYDLAGKAVLIHTGWDRHWRTDAYFENHPFLTAAAAEHLVRAGVLLVGIDSLNIDDTSDRARPVHTALLGAEIPICEHLTNLGALPRSGFSVSAVPVKVKSMGTFPVRAFAIIDGTRPALARP